MSSMRVKNKLLVPLIVVSIVGLAVGGSATGLWLDRHIKYNDLTDDYEYLENKYQILTGNYDDLEMDYDELQDAIDAIETVISQTTLPVQYSFFAESVRRTYMPQYLAGKTDKTFWRSVAEYSRDIVLHDSSQENSFQTVSDAVSGCLHYGSNTMSLAYYIMYSTFYDWLPNWDGWGLVGTELQKIDDVHQWCVDEIEYEYDTDIQWGQADFNYDYIKFPVETAFRTMGDCEDQAILEAAYLESCGYETAFAIFHDDAHPVLGDFYHGTLLVHIEDTAAFFSAYPSCPLWNLGSSDPYIDYTWCWLDPTWDVPFGSIPSWLQNYRDASGISYSFFTLAICDTNGGIA